MIKSNSLPPPNTVAAMIVPLWSRAMDEISADVADEPCAVAPVPIRRYLPLYVGDRCENRIL